MTELRNLHIADPDTLIKAKVDSANNLLVKALLQANNPSSAAETLNLNSEGELLVHDNSSPIEVSRGNVAGLSVYSQLGNAPDISTTAGEATIWDGANNGGIAQLIYNFSTTAAIDSLSSSNAADTQDILVEGLDTNYDYIQQIATLNGQSIVSLATNLIRVFKITNIGTTDIAGTVYCFENVAVTAGVPNDLTKIRAIISGSNNRSLMSIYTVPAGYTGYIRSGFASTAGASKSSNYIIRAYTRAFGRVFILSSITAISDNGTSFAANHYTEPTGVPEKTDIMMTVQMTATGGLNGSVSNGLDFILEEN